MYNTREKSKATKTKPLPTIPKKRTSKPPYAKCVKLGVQQKKHLLHQPTQHPRRTLLKSATLLHRGLVGTLSWNTRTNHPSRPDTSSWSIHDVILALSAWLLVSDEFFSDVATSGVNACLRFAVSLSTFELMLPVTCLIIYLYTVLMIFLTVSLHIQPDRKMKRVSYSCVSPRLILNSSVV